MGTEGNFCLLNSTRGGSSRVFKPCLIEWLKIVCFTNPIQKIFHYLDCLCGVYIVILKGVLDLFLFPIFHFEQTLLH